MASDLVLGDRIRELRTEKGLSVRKLARLSGLTPGFISQVESGKSEPSLASLRNIARALGVSLARFMDAPSPNGVVVRAGERLQFRWPRSHVTFELASPANHKSVQLVLARIEPGGMTAEEPVTHSAGEEVSLILGGTVEVVVGEERHTLHDGDSICLDRSTPHQYINRGDTPVLLVCCVSPPTF